MAFARIRGVFSHVKHRGMRTWLSLSGRRQKKKTSRVYVGFPTREERFSGGNRNKTQPNKYPTLLLDVIHPILYIRKPTTNQIKHQSASNPRRFLFSSSNGCTPRLSFPLSCSVMRGTAAVSPHFVSEVLPLKRSAKYLHPKNSRWTNPMAYHSSLCDETQKVNGISQLFEVR